MLDRIKSLNDQELLMKTKSIVLEEKKYTTRVLEHLQEVESRKLYCDLGIHSLFSYCTKVLKYSDAEASVRVNATRLIKVMPQVKKEIASGEINLSSASKLQSFFNHNKTEEQEKKDILSRIKGKSTRETEKILRAKDHRKERTKLLALNERLLKKLEMVQEEFGDCSELEAIEALLDRHLEKKEEHRPQRKSNVASKGQRYITRKTKQIVNGRAHGQCEFISVKGKRCECRSNLQYDHIRPISIGGQSAESNLRKLCFNHNQRARIKMIKFT